MTATTILFSVVLLVSYTITVLSQQQQQECPGVGSLRKKTSNSNQYRMTTIQDGNFTIQVLITLSSDSSLCSKVWRDGLIRTFALKFALEKFNLNPEYSSYATLGLQIDDVCRSLPITMARGIEVVSFHRPNSVCRTDFLKCDSGKAFEDVQIKEASAIIGTAMSFTTIPLASLMSLYYIPQVSFSASSRLLSKKDLYKSFFRTIPSDTNQISVMIDLFKKFDWNYIFAIGSDDDYGKLGVSGLKQVASQNDICISSDEYVPFQSSRTEEKIKEIVQNIKQEPKAQVVVLFCYSENLGDMILAEAQKEGVQRVWLTSESWNPSAAVIFSQPKWRNGGEVDLQNQTHGLLSVALKRPKIPVLLDWIRNYTQTNYACDMWFKQYLVDKYGCTVTNYTNNQFTCANDTFNNMSISMKNLMTDLSNFPGHIDRLIDAATSLGYAMHKVIRKHCFSADNCTLTKLPTREITDEMFKTNFTNEQGDRITYNAEGDPEFAYYTIENLVFNETEQKFEFVQVGDWDQRRSGNHLVINDSLIQWPVWFNGSNKATASDDYIPANLPASRCSDRCVPGQYVVLKNLCCWACQNCIENNYTNTEMSNQCYSCGEYAHTLNNINCTKTPIKWLKIDNPAGLSIVIISMIGLLGTIASSTFIMRHWNLVMVHEKSAPLMGFVLVLMFLTFIYGPFHIVEPTNLLCQVRNSYFFVLLMVYCAFVLVKTESMVEYLQSYADSLFRGNMLVCQFVVLFLFFLLEMASIAAWLYLDGSQVEEFRGTSPVVQLIEIQCKVDFTAARLVSTFIPCIILIIATFCAFRERNADHSFYEPKFLSFSCIALCIIIVAFLPTFNYVYGIYKAIVWAFTVNVFGFTFMACLILPKVYAGVMRKRKGINEYPMKPGAVKKDDKDEKEKRKENKKKKKIKDKRDKGIDRSDMSSFRTKSTIVNNETTDGDKSSEIGGSDDGEKLPEETTNGVTKHHGVTNGYQNETYEGGDVDVENGAVKKELYDDESLEIETGSPPPDYQTSINEKAAVKNTIL